MGIPSRCLEDMSLHLSLSQPVGVCANWFTGTDSVDHAYIPAQRILPIYYGVHKGLLLLPPLQLGVPRSKWLSLSTDYSVRTPSRQQRIGTR